MKFSIKDKEKMSIIATCFVVAAITTVTVTTALLKDSTQVLANNFTVGSIETEIEEDVSTYGEKNPAIRNTGENAALVRVRCLVSPEDMADNIVLNFGTDDTGSWYDGLETDSTEISIKMSEGSEENIKYANELTEEYYYYWDVIYPEDEVDKNHITTCFFDGYSIVDDNGESIFESDINSENFGKLKEGVEFKPFEITVYQESVQATVTTEDGTVISAVNEDGSFNVENAKIIWEAYDTQL